MNSDETRTLIVGMGITGNNLYQELQSLNPDIYDIDKDKLPLNWERRYTEYGFIFICVDTPYRDKDNPCDISAVKEAVETWEDCLAFDGIFVIKSTLLPWQIDKFIEKYDNTRIVYSPEYYGNTQHCNNFKFDFTILGGGKYKSACYRVQQLLQLVHDARHTFRIVDVVICFQIL